MRYKEWFQWACTCKAFGTPFWWEQNHVGKHMLGFDFRVQNTRWCQFPETPLFCICTSLFILEDIKIKKDKYTKECLHLWLKWSQRQQLATLDSTTQQLRKKVKKFPFILVNSTLQAYLYSLGMPGARLQKCGALQAFCLAWQRTGERACGCFGFITLPNVSCNMSWRTRILTSTYGVLPEK